MGRRSFEEIVEDVLTGLDALHDEPFSINDLAEFTGISYEAAKKVLLILEKFYTRGYLKKVKDRPKMYIWIPESNIEGLLATKFFRLLLLRESLSFKDMKEEYALTPEESREIFEILVKKKLARWIDDDRIGLLPIKHYLNLVKEVKE